MSKKNGHTCALCLSPTRGPSGEHALPLQFLKTLNQANTSLLGEHEIYAATYRGHAVQETKKLGSPLSAVRLACCPPCNGWLDRTFEKPAKWQLPYLVQGHSLIEMPPGDLAPLSRWIIKTVLICHHPAVWYTDMSWKSKAAFPKHIAVPALLEELKQSGQPPQKLFLWATLHTGHIPPLFLPDGEVTLAMGMNIARPDLQGTLRLTVTDASHVKAVPLPGMRSHLRRLWPL